MATGIQTGIRTGSAPLPTGKGPAGGGGGGLGKVLAQWNSMSVKAKILCVSIVVVLVGGLIIGLAVQKANQPVSLYATNLSPSDMAEIGQKLNQMNINYSIEGSKIMVLPSKRSQIVGLLLAEGLPHRPLVSTQDNSGGMSPKTDSEKRAQQNQELENQLVDEIRQFDVVADAYVQIVPADDDSIEGTRDAKASVELELKPGKQPSQTQIQAILNLMAFSVPGLKPENVRVVDRSGYVWNDGTKIAPGPNPGNQATASAFGDENLQIKQAYEKQYTQKVQTALDKILGAGNYTVAVNADLDFSQKKIVTDQVGAPGGDNQVVTQKETNKEIYNNGSKSGKQAADKAGASQVGVPITAGSNGGNTAYEKVKIVERTQHGDVQSTVIVPPGMVRKLTAAIGVNGKHDPAELASIKNIVAGAIGMDESRGDNVTVDNMAFQTNPNNVVGADMAPPGYWDGHNRSAGGGNPTAIVAAMVVPTAILLMVLAIFLIKQRKVQVDKTGLILSSSTGTTTSDISDLLSDKIGRSTAVSHTTKVNNTEQLEKLAKEKPTKVAELLKSTWLSDKER